MEYTKFEMMVKTENAVFEDMVEVELARILRHVADQLENGYSASVILDINGNRVGSWECYED